MRKPAQIPVFRAITERMPLAGETAILASGLSIAFGAASLVIVANGCYDSMECSAGLCLAATGVFVLGLLATGFGLALFRRSTKSRKIECGTAAWLLEKAEFSRRPMRARRRRLVRLASICTPSAIAIVVIFFFPAATHLVHPSSWYFAHYRLPIPWNFAVLPANGSLLDYRAMEVIVGSGPRGRLGLTALRVWPFWEEERLSKISFWFWLAPKSSISNGEVADRQFRGGNTVTTCSQRRSEWRPLSPLYLRLSGTGPMWEVFCTTTTTLDPWEVGASFFGGGEDLHAFYRIMGGISAVQ